MILIADGGSTKADWIALDSNKKEHFRVRTLGLNPAVISSEELTNRIINMFQLINIKDEVTQVYFYGAGCGTPKANAILKVAKSTNNCKGATLYLTHSPCRDCPRSSCQRQPNEDPEGELARERRRAWIRTIRDGVLHADQGVGSVRWENVLPALQH